jgi:hypothetical protein
LLHRETVGLVVGLEELRFQIFKLLVSVAELLLELLYPAQLGRLFVLKPHQRLAHLAHLGLQGVKVLCAIVQIEVQPLDFSRPLVCFTLQGINLLLSLLPQRLKLSLKVGVFLQGLVPLGLQRHQVVHSRLEVLLQGSNEFLRLLLRLDGRLKVLHAAVQLPLQVLVLQLEVVVLVAQIRHLVLKLLEVGLVDRRARPARDAAGSRLRPLVDPGAGGGPL